MGGDKAHAVNSVNVQHRLQCWIGETIERANKHINNGGGFQWSWHSLLASIRIYLDTFAAQETA